MEIINIIFFVCSILQLVIGIKLLLVSKRKDILLATIGAFFTVIGATLFVITFYVINKQLN